jgi:integrase
MRVIKRIKYINQYRDRYGRQRYYLRRPGKPQIALPGEPGSSEFERAYNNAVKASSRVGEIGKDRSILGTVSAAIAGYYMDNSFLMLGENTRTMRRAVLERFRNEHGDKALARLRHKDVAYILGKLKPFAQRNWLKTLRGLMNFSVKSGLREDDPTVGIKLDRVKAGRIHTWDEPEIERFEAKYPVGSRPRLAMALMLYTAQRRSDVVVLGPQHIRHGKLYVRQKKTGMAKADEVLEIPIHPALAEIITASDCVGISTFLVTVQGRPFTAAGFGNLFRMWCREAGVPECSPHGLRKAACRRLAEIGCTVPQIAAISGHKSLSEVQRYIAGANQAQLARAAMRKLIERGTEG